MLRALEEGVHHQIMLENVLLVKRVALSVAGKASWSLGVVYGLSGLRLLSVLCPESSEGQSLLLNFAAEPFGFVSLPKVNR